MDKPLLPDSPIKFAKRLSDLREQRQLRQRQRRMNRVRRRSLNAKHREIVWAKTDSRCHICGGLVETEWQADHVLAHSSGGSHSIENYLAAHSLCNNYRWDYSSEEFQWILKIGVWARTQMEQSRGVGQNLGAKTVEAFFKKEKKREGRGHQFPEHENCETA